MRNLRLFDTAHTSHGPSASVSDAAYGLYSTLVSLINRMDGPHVARTGIIPWGAPVPTFGDLSTSRVATVGLNPSNREFMDPYGHELRGASRRFHTLHSLGLSSWAEIDARHLRLILATCRSYFHINPYDRWFRPLNRVLSGTHTSYYDTSSSVCHLDLIPYATTSKWTALTPDQRSALLDLAGNSLAELLRDSAVRVILLNGHSVVHQFRALTGVRLAAQPMPTWSLPRTAGPGVAGFSYSALVDSIGGLRLDHEVLVLGYNHNPQSSFGVTTNVVRAIGEWVRAVSAGVSP